MGILDFLLGKDKTPTATPQPDGKSHVSGPHREAVEPGFKTAEWVIHEAFSYVMATVEVSSETKNRLFREYSKAHRDGDPRGEEKAVVDALANSGWRWKDFEEWSQRFKTEKKWPYMWRSFPELYEAPPSDPTTINDALEYMTVNDMKAFATARGLMAKPVPRKRADFEKLIAARCPLQNVLPAVAPAVKRAVAAFAERREIAKCRLLAHTLTMRMYSVRNKVQFDELNKTVGGYKLKILAGAGCPVEDKYAAMFNRGEIQDLPPFFPGDRNAVTTGRRGTGSS